MTARVVTLGETMALLRTPSVGSLVHAPHLAVSIGGAESNVAIALQRLGTDATWIGRVGDDPLGIRVAREIRAEGVDVRAVADAGAPTGLMLKEQPTSSTTAVHYYRAGSAGSRLEAADLPDGIIEDADLLHVSGITALLSASAAETLESAVQRARAAGTPVSFDVNYRASLAAADDAVASLARVAASADILFGGIDELRLVGATGETPEELVASLASDGRAVVAKLGADGAIASVDGAVVRSPGFDVDVVDTVGAGDAFVAGFLSARLEGLSAEECLRRANACGAFLCMGAGDWESSPRPADIARFLDDDGEPVRR